MRKNFAQVLKSGNVDIKKEYLKLYHFLFEKYRDHSYNETSIYNQYAKLFYKFWFRGTALTLQDFDEENGFSFDEDPKNFNIDYLVSFCEYFYNLNLAYRAVTASTYSSEINIDLIQTQIDRVISAIGYKQMSQDNLIVFVEKSPAAISVSETIDDSDLSYKTLYYNHHSMRGDIDGKKEILLKFANYLEPKRKKLRITNSSLENDLFYLFNNLNLRHNNTDQTDTKHYRAFVAKMSTDELEKCYDEIYQMSLLACLELENTDRKDWFNNLKERIEGN